VPETKAIKPRGDYDACSFIFEPRPPFPESLGLPELHHREVCSL
jgi:hypothetical protein